LLTVGQFSEPTTFAFSGVIAVAVLGALAGASETRVTSGSDGYLKNVVRGAGRLRTVDGTEAALSRDRSVARFFAGTSTPDPSGRLSLLAVG
jgi:hypothetical protein